MKNHQNADPLCFKPYVESQGAKERTWSAKIPKVLQENLNDALDEAKPSHAKRNKKETTLNSFLCSLKLESSEEKTITPSRFMHV